MRVNQSASRPRPAGTQRVLLVVVAVIGLGLAAAPFAFDMFSRAPKGAVMLTEFKPFMTSQRLDGFQNDMGQINAAVHEIDTQATPRLAAGGGNGHRSGAGPSYRTFDAQWPAIDSTMTHLLGQVQGNLANYSDVAALPSFRLFPWFFLIPGVLIFGLALAALFGALRTVAVRISLVVLGIGLILAPVAFGMFNRAPHGAQMMSAFRSIETTQNVTRIQGYFSTMAVGQGAIRIDLVPALEHTGLTAAQVAQRYPAMTRLDRHWVHILNDMTPMIGAMSDSVPDYQAITALPPFTLFPWFFVIPGALIIALAAVRVRRDPVPESAPEPVSVPETQKV
jgi:hypothetical protein